MCNATTAICTTPWETRLLPVKYADVVEAWKRDTEGHEEFQDFRQFDVLYGILHLVDRCWLAIDGVENSAPDKIYPCSLESLIGTAVVETKRQSIRTHCRAAISKTVTTGGAFLRNPTVARVAGAAAGELIGSTCLIA